MRAKVMMPKIPNRESNPWRLDLDWRWHRRALERGCMMSINPDAHSTDEIDLTHWRVEMARKGGVPAERVLNALTLPVCCDTSNGARTSRSARPEEMSFAKALASR